MKVALISRSGRLEFKNSSDLRRDHLYFLMMYAARAHVALLWPLTEWTRTDSVASSASSMKSKIALAASSLGSSNNYLNFKNFSYLVVLIKPKESEIGHADWFPVVLNLFPSAVYYMRDLIRHNELEILPNSLRRAYG